MATAKAALVAAVDLLVSVLVPLFFTKVGTQERCWLGIWCCGEAVFKMTGMTDLCLPVNACCWGLESRSSLWVVFNY